MKHVYLISRLWTDPSENQISAAIGYTAEGIVLNQEEAQAMVAAAGMDIGTGWPIRKGEAKPNLIMQELAILTTPETPR